MIACPEWRVWSYSAKLHLAAPVEGRLDGDGGVAWTVEPQRLPITRVGRVAGDDPGQVVC